MFIRILPFAIAAVGLTLVAGCGENAQPADATAATQPSAALTHKGGAELWAENCARCHNIRAADSYSDAQWQTTVHHMRLRANLTGEEQRTITAFLQASH